MIKTPLSAAIGGAFWTPSATILGSTSKTFNQLIKSLFANGEQGFAYDPNDLSTMYQDAAGTVPVTGAGQAVGLMLDKSKGLVLGSELFIESNVILTFQSTKISAGYYNIYSTGDTSAVMTSITGGTKWRVVEYEITRIGSGSIRIDYASGVNAGLPTTLGRRKVYIYGDRVNFVRNTTPTDVDFKIYSIKELAGNHAYQTNAASRPLLQRNSTTGAYYLAFDGSDDFLVTNSIDFTATDKISLFAGVRRLSDASSANLVELSISTGSQNGSFHLRTPTNSGLANVDWSSKGTVRVFATSPSVYTSPTSIVISTKGNISGDSAILRVNGGQVASSIADQGTGNFGNHPLYIGRRGGTENPFNGHIYSLIGIGRLTTDSETAAIEKELAKQLGVTLSV